jgi:hypothetical protein
MQRSVSKKKRRIGKRQRKVAKRARLRKIARKRMKLHRSEK